MWDTRKLLLATIVFTVLDYKHLSKVTVESKKLDMAPDAVDDLYHECREKANEKFIQSGLLKEELNLDQGFKKAWSANTCAKLIAGGMKEHATALSTYANGEKNFIKTFDNAVKTMGVNVSTYENSFHYKSLHFLLMDSIRLAQKQNAEQCRTVYLLREGKYTAQVGATVRFGGFTKVSTSYSEMKNFHDFDETVIFNITSCFLVNLGDNICNGDTDTALLSPAEMFTVRNVTVIEDSMNESQYTAIVLETPVSRSFHNCYIFSRSPAGVSTQWLVLVLVVSPFLA
uniref:erythroblast NAD(P)(+)--arginine ADP-ribosyltransferase-like n=1 Tax=Semicossyphus pulcher TaxID=241346 RepID=UPI0037E7E6E2